MAARADSGAITPIAGRTLSATVNERPVADRAATTSARRVDVAGHHDGAAIRALAEARGVVQQHFRVAAVGAAHEQHEVGSAVPQRLHVGAGERPRRSRGRPARRRSGRPGAPPGP